MAVACRVGFIRLSRTKAGIYPDGPPLNSAWEQEKLEAGKMLNAKRAAESPSSDARFVGLRFYSILSFSSSRNFRIRIFLISGSGA